LKEARKKLFERGGGGSPFSKDTIRGKQKMLREKILERGPRERKEGGEKHDLGTAADLRKIVEKEHTSRREREGAISCEERGAFGEEEKR